MIRRVVRAVCKPISKMNAYSLFLIVDKVIQKSISLTCKALPLLIW